MATTSVERSSTGSRYRAAGDDEDLVDVAQVLVAQPDLVQHDVARLGEPADQGLGDRLGLLGYLLEHEVVVAALLRGRGVPVDVEVLTGARVAGKVGDRHGVRSDHHNLVLTQLGCLARVLDERRDVASQIVLALSAADHERGVAPGADHRPGSPGIDGEQRERALQAAAHPPHRLGEVGHLGRLELTAEQVRHALGIGVAGELDVALLQLGPELGEILDDPVVDHTDPAVRREMRMGVAVGGAAMRGPPGVPDGGGAFGDPCPGPGAVAGRPPISAGPRRRMPVGALGQRLLQVGELPGMLLDQELISRDDRYAR